MYQNVIELKRCRPESICTAASKPHRRLLSSRAQTPWQSLIAAAELLVTAAIGVCVLFCLGLTISML